MINTIPRIEGELAASGRVVLLAVTALDDAVAVDARRAVTGVEKNFELTNLTW